MIRQHINALFSNFFNRCNYTSKWVILFADVFFVGVSTLISLLLFNRFFIPIPVIDYLRILLVSFFAAFVLLGIFNVNSHVVRHSSLRSLAMIVVVLWLKAIVVFITLSFIATPIPPILRVVLTASDFLFASTFIVGMRLGLILFYDTMLARLCSNSKRVLVYGGKDESVSLKMLLYANKEYKVIGFLEHKLIFRKYQLSDLPVFYFDTFSNFSRFIEKYDVQGIIFPNYDTVKSEAERLVVYCQKLGVRLLVVPPIDVMDETVANTIRDISIEDLLGRDEIAIDMNEIASRFCNKVVMVTGGAGSIGSELCRQLATFGVRHLVVYDNAETPVHELRLELENRFPQLSFTPRIGDVRNIERLRTTFELFHPQIVFHAAAYKHVPLMEENPCEAICVNVTGTRQVADMCVQYNVEKMVMVSTDKAVNPTNVMGASKRLAEIYVQSLGLAIARGERKGTTHFVTTRFGNVLGSNGSVIPYFKKQIAQGGPVTVTHPDIMRYFMTIPEACRLVMEAATISSGNEIFVFDMGKPVKIVDLALRMIRLAGFVPGKDIKIVYTGLRPGEKLFEELLSKEEDTIPTVHPKIRIARVRDYPYLEVVGGFKELEQAAWMVDVEATVNRMKQLIPEYISNNSVFEKLDAPQPSSSVPFINHAYVQTQPHSDYN